MSSLGHRSPSYFLRPVPTILRQAVDGHGAVGICKDAIKRWFYGRSKTTEKYFRAESVIKKLADVKPAGHITEDDERHEV